MSEFHSKCELLIVHTTEAQEWATYLQRILKSSRKFPKRSIVLHAVDMADYHQSDLTNFHKSKCILLLLTAAFLDILKNPDVLGTFQRVLHSPHRVVTLLCGVSEDDVSTDYFEHWQSWRKLYAEDEPSLYISTILQSMADGRTEEAENETNAEVKTEHEVTPVTVVENPKAEGTEEESQRQTKSIQGSSDDVSSETLPSQAISPTHPACLTVQPNRVLCGDQVTIFIILTNKLENQLKMEVEFSSEDSAMKRVPGTYENEYTISVNSPDMPAGVVSLTLFGDDSSVCLKPVTYYTAIGEISNFLEKATAPMDFMCQAFNITSNATGSLDNLLTDSLKCRMPASGLKLFGIRQIEENNMSAYQRNEELPTLLHFAAKYGLKKLTTVLLQCPGALQAYSVMNKYGDYPNTLAERSGFSDLRQFMDDFVETADMLKSHIIESIITEEDEEVYESMSNSSRDIIMKYSLNPGCKEDIYESMIGLNPDCMEDLYEDMDRAVGESVTPEEAMLRKFFQGKPDLGLAQEEGHANTEDLGEEEEAQEMIEEEEDPYNLCVPDQIYDTVDENASYIPDIFNRPPAPIPRPVKADEPEEAKTYISRVFSGKEESNPQSNLREAAPFTAKPIIASSSVHDPYAGMKTPGQRQLIALQERVKVGDLSVDDAVQEFKTWKFDQERRSHSLRFQQENLKKLRDSITRRHKEKEKIGNVTDLEITAPIQRNLQWGSNMTVECSVYEPAPRILAPPPPMNCPIQRGTWQTGSTSSTSSSGSNRLSTHSTTSYSSGTEPEDTIDVIPPPPRPLRPAETAPLLPPPRIPPRLPDRVPESVLQERYISCPSRALPQRPGHRTDSPPPIPRRTR